MRRTPSGDDEQIEYSRPRVARASRAIRTSRASRASQTQRPERTQRSSRPSRQNEPIEASEQTATDYHSDEYPGIPKIKRASRLLEDEPLPTTPSTAELPVVEGIEDELEDDELSEQYISDKIMVSKRPRRGVYQPPDSYDPSTQRPPRSQRSQPKQRAQRQARLHTQYVRRGRHEKRRQPRQPRTLLSLLQDFSHNQTLMLVATILLLLVIILPIAINGIISNTHTTAGLLPGGSQRSGSPQTLGHPPADPHEIVISPPESDHPAPPVFATAAYLLDADTGATLYARNPFMHLPMMSTTKLMTAVIAIERGNLDQKVTINNAINHDLSQLSADSSVMGIKKGETYSLRDLLYGLLLVSGNDDAVVIADTVGGNLPHFVSMMNERASQLGLQDTHYMNPHGLLAAGHYSSAHDLAILGRYALSLPMLHQISGTKTYDIPQNGSHPDHYLINGNQFLWWYPGVDGGKPGWDGGSNFVQVVSCVRNNHHLIGVTMHTSDWWTDMRDLMNWGFDDFRWISPYDVDLHSPIPYDNEWDYFVKDKKDVTIPTADQGRYYIYTGYSVSGLILTYFDKNGGLGKFGYPTGLLNVTGGTTISQHFEHTTIQCDTASRQCGTS